MKRISELSVFRLLSEHAQRKASVAELTDAIAELAVYLAEISRTEQDYSPITLFFTGIK